MTSTRLSDITTIVMGQSPPGESCNRMGDGTPLLNGPTEFGPHHPKAVQFTTDAKRHAKRGDLLFCVRGSTGRMNWADQEYAIGRGVAAIKHKTNSRLQPLIRGLIECQLPGLLQSATGSTFPNVSARQLGELVVPNLSTDQWEDAVDLLAAFDDKIELNRWMNETLESTARAIFRDWFADLGPTRAMAEGRAPYLAPELWDLFPDALDEENKPVGWWIGKIGDCFRLTMGQSPPGSTYNDQGEGLPFFQGRTDFGFRYPKNRKYCTAPTRIAERDDTLVSVRAPVGDINMAWEKCCAGRGVAALRHESGSRSFTYYSALAIQRELEQYEHTGTVFGAINKKQFEALSVVEPTSEVVSLFESLVGPLDERIRKNVSENRTLTQTRELLLPKLMSGEIRLREAEKAVRAVA